jgi:hypothetical protein
MASLCAFEFSSTFEIFRSLAGCKSQKYKLNINANTHFASKIKYRKERTFNLLDIIYLMKLTSFAPVGRDTVGY